MIDLKELKKFTKDMKVLYVEDDKLIRSEIQEYLERFFPVVDLADDGQEGLELYKKGEYDLVFSDINMPKMNGIEMSKAILKENPNQAIIINSAYNESEYLLELFNAGIEYYVLKPVNMKQLTKTIYKVAQANHNKKIAQIYNKSTINQDKELEIKKENRKIDNLTGLEDLSEFIKNITSDDANKAEFSVLILLDIDDLQNINELYGADSSNEVIVSFSKLLSSFAQELSYKIYRANGSQFILLDQVKYIDTEKYEDEFNTLQKRIKEFSVYLNEAGKEIDINATIGMSLGEDRIFEHADMALKSAKDKYQSYAVYNTQIDTTREMEKKIEWQCRIILALKNDCIVPVYHPIVDIDGNIVKYEALMRLVEVEDGEEKLFSPVHFLEIALESKYYNALSSMMIHKVLDSLKAHQHTISINLTYTDIQNKVFINTILERIKNEHIGERVIVEILESESIKDYELLKDIIIKFRQIGVKIAIDDFGSGFSNFKHILEIRPDYIKIDGSLIENIDIDSHAYILTNGITTFFHQLGVIMIAEYVHTKEIYEILKQMNMDQYQGYYFSEPVRYI